MPEIAPEDRVIITPSAVYVTSAQLARLRAATAPPKGQPWDPQPYFGGKALYLLSPVTPERRRPWWRRALAWLAGRAGR